MKLPAQYIFEADQEMRVLCYFLNRLWLEVSMTAIVLIMPKSFEQEMMND